MILCCYYQKGNVEGGVCMAKDNLIITIGRQYGSGGIEIGRRLSEMLGIPCYDKELAERAAKESKINEKFFREYDEKIIRSLYYFGADEYDATIMPQSQELFRAQAAAIRAIAESESCIFIGRCADLILRDFPNCINVFLHSSRELRIKRMIDVYGVPEGEVDYIMEKIDKQRQKYHNIFSDKKWNDISIYSLAVDSGRLGMEKTAKLISDYIKLACDKS
ncbi:cytidylate kinase-like family protein [bacterium]|nr:cytidylate kinase-like family protein [bacterium]